MIRIRIRKHKKPSAKLIPGVPTRRDYGFVQHPSGKRAKP